MRPKPTLTPEMRTQVLWHRDKVRICELEYKIAELTFALADRAAALRSIELTEERATIEQVINTSEWRFDFDTYDFVPRAQDVPPAPPEVFVEATWIKGVFTADVDPETLPPGARVTVRVRHPADTPAPEAEAAAIARFATASVHTVAVTDLAVRTEHGGL